MENLTTSEKEESIRQLKLFKDSLAYRSQTEGSEAREFGEDLKAATLSIKKSEKLYLQYDNIMNKYYLVLECWLI